MKEQTNELRSCFSEFCILIVKTVEQASNLLRVEARVDGELVTGVFNKKAK